MNRRCFLVFSLVLMMSSRGTFRASDAVSIPLEEMALGSDVILTGVCVSSTSRWEPSSRMIMTDSVVRVDRYIKGAGPTTVLVTSLGGALPEYNLAMSVAEMAQFRPGEEVLLFLLATPGRSHSLYGMGRGKQVIQLDPVTRVRKIRGQLLETFISEIGRIMRNQGRK